ncbi:MAG: hypothetical protein CMA81_02030 [Euryarchaeota archaeon]|nr:hypothetical protein [Euryarchaeota archaeon]
MSFSGGLNKMASNSLSSRSVALLPVLIMIFIHVFVTPLREIFSIEPLFLVPWYGFGILIGIIIYRKTFVVKDYEYRRSNVMKKMKKVYEAEESGVWQTNAAIESDFSEIGKVKLQQKIGDINTESPEMEISNDQKVEVQFLNEASHIVEATRRVTGESNFEETEINSTIGSTRKSSPMDRLLDGVASLFGRKDSRTIREENRINALKAASKAAPVYISRPNTPLQTTRRDVDSTLKATSMTDQGEQEDFLISNANESQSDYVEPQAAIKYPQNQEVYSWDTEMQTTNAQSIESMAMIPGQETSTLPNSSAKVQKTCQSCGYVILEDERFCQNCGMEIQH